MTGKAITVDSLKSNFLILYFNDILDDGSNIQLNDLARLKNEKGDHVTIVYFLFSHKQDQLAIQSLIGKYQKEILFIPDADDYINNHNARSGLAVNRAI